VSNDPGTTPNPCGDDASAAALVAPFNRPGLSALSYRIGIYATFLADMRSQIHAVSIPDGPNRGARPLAALTTRAGDDPALALLDAWAVVADVLTFYQERIANEGYLRTATERLSVLELARMIGYELGAGVAASTFLAFTVDDTQNAHAVVTVPRGTKVQNVPPQGKLPQTFETIEPIAAFSARNALHARLTRPQDLALVFDPGHQFDPQGSPLGLYMLGLNATFPMGSFVTIPASRVYPLNRETIPDQVAAVPVKNQVYFAGTRTNLQKGDRLLIVGRNDRATPSVQTKVVVVREVEVQASLDRTRVDLRDDLGQSPDPPPFVPAKYEPVRVFTELSALTLRNLGAVIRGRISEGDLGAYVRMNRWPLEQIAALAVEAVFTPPPTPPPPNPSAVLPPPDPGIFALRTHVGFFGNNAPFYNSLLAPAGQGFGPAKNFLYPNNWDKDGWEIWKDSLADPVQFYRGADVFLEQVVPGILRDSWVVLELPAADPVAYRVGGVIETAMAGFGLSGRATGLRLTTVDGTTEIQDRPPQYLVRDTIAYAQSEALGLVGLPIADDILAGATELMLDNLVLGLRPGQPVALTGSRIAGDAPGVIANEVLTLQGITHVGGFTSLTFTAGLAYSYVRSTVTLNANVARATHGETVTETMGGGDASQANQTFALKRPPLTYVTAPTATGAQSTLEVRVNDLPWREVPSLFELGPRDQGYIVRLADDGTTSVTFGDGINGARLPTGQQNVVVTYRTGIGPDGNVGAGSLGLFQTRPAGIRAVTNPQAAAGAAAREDLDHARLNAPLKVLTLDRIVSLDDYENFARAFAGIGKAQARALWSGERYLVHLTVAGANGEAVDVSSALYVSLVGAVAQARDPVQHVLLTSYQPLFFNIGASVLVDQPRYVAAEVLAAVSAALRDAFSFDRRQFAQAATAAEVISVIQSVPGVVATDLTRLFPVTVARGGERFEGLLPVLHASPAHFQDGRILPAELLVVNPAGITLTEIQP
jgi:predicted phage baseplate assembly protein